MFKRFFEFTSKIIVLFLVFALVGINLTSSYFSDEVNSEVNTFSTGWWVVPTVSVNTPIAGDTLYQGNTYNITWTTASSDPAASTTVDIYYSTDGGISYPNLISSGEANDGTYSWTAPNIFSSAVKIKITATDSHTLVNSAESGQFSIKSPIVLNEFIPNPVGIDTALKPGGEWVELYNNGSITVDVNGWVLYDAVDTHDLVVSISNSDNNDNPTDAGETTVPAHGFLVVYRNGDANFSLNNDGDTLRLYNNAISSGGVLIDSYTYTTTKAEGSSYARIPDGTGTWVDPYPTPGKPNVLTENYLNILVALDTINAATNSATPSATLDLSVSTASLSSNPLPVSSGSASLTPDAFPSEPTLSSTPTPMLSLTPEPTETPTPTPSPEPTSEPTETPTPTPTPTP